MSTPKTRLTTFLEKCRNRIDADLEKQLSTSGNGSDRLQQAMRYSVLGGGKRIRPALCLAAAAAVGQDEESAIVPACCLELIHAYSLIHDDLPAMDDDELRRGRATTHIAFDEATAILAGDALQTLAFGLLAEAPWLDNHTRLAMIRELASASGHLGMVGGQAIDLESVGRSLTIEQLEKMHRHKTGALIAASVRLGALTAPNVTENQLHALTIYSQTLGLAFQVQDDLLDVEGDTTVIGKPQGSDVARAKPTYPSLLGTAGARDYLSQLLDASLASLEGFGTEGDILRDMAGYVVARTH
ncbi:polyprenyl synthetase family protein [Marinobacter sp. TBZ242]|uniref:Polyprenyl synthetase family protein n=1 Tax=Marinobacter azerbaijanicus TaxID=3050455 RepID=A0ABT7IC12_9GAMM|nr:farnesyl diphosphate synthase [Marinobacter sp. TBZ242]MDL0430713.1 polyprenyl synthetase family protein [Marinobacter sp. TBZ242]